MNDADLFRVEAVEITAPPADAVLGDDDSSSLEPWCRYVIANRSSRVVGRYRGSLVQTRRNAEQLASSFNERALSNRSAWTPRAQAKRKPSRRKAAN